MALALIFPLRSYSDKDLLPGLEVRLLPHQLIGVNWYEYYVGFCAYINFRAQDGGPRKKVPSQGWYLSVSNFYLSIYVPYVFTRPRDEMGLGQLF